MAVTFHQADIKQAVPQRAALAKFIQQRIKATNGKRANISYILCSDEYLLDINRRFLNHHYFTDIITFPLHEDEKSLEAEIYISIPRVKENALKYAAKQTAETDSHALFTHEFLRVVFHGVLHLLGHSDKTKTQQAAMRHAEEEWIAAFTK